MPRVVDGTRATHCRTYKCSDAKPPLSCARLLAELKSVDTVTDSLRKMPRKVAGGSTSNATKGPAEGEDQQISYLDNFLQGARSVPPQRTRFPSHGST